MQLLALLVAVDASAAVEMSSERYDAQSTSVSLYDALLGAAELY